MYFLAKHVLGQSHNMLFPMGILIPAHCWIYHKWGYCMGLFKDMVKLFFYKPPTRKTLYNDSPGENSHHAMPKASLSTWRSSSSQAMTRPVSYALLLPILVGQSWFLSYIYMALRYFEELQLHYVWESLSTNAD